MKLKGRLIRLWPSVIPMKNSRPLLALILSSAFVLPAGALFAAKNDGPKPKVFAKYDKNKNGKLDVDEYAAVRADFAKNPKGDLAKLDRNADGTLSDDELTAFAPGKGKSDADRTAKRAKKAQQSQTTAATTPEKSAATEKPAETK